MNQQDRQILEILAAIRGESTPKPESRREAYGKIVQLTGPENVLIIGDIHEPFTLPDYMDFCQRTRDKFQCEKVIFAGDIVDGHALSFWDHSSSGYSAGHELAVTRAKLKAWYKAFPNAHICVGNHDSRHFRKARKAGLPDEFMRGYKEVYRSPMDWQWAMGFRLNGVVYTHGTKGGMNAALKEAKDRESSTVVGHAHTSAGVQYYCNYVGKLKFGMNVGCGIDAEAYAFEYGKNHSAQPTLGCGVVLDNGQLPIFNPFRSE